MHMCGPLFDVKTHLSEFALSVFKLFVSFLQSKPQFCLQELYSLKFVTHLTLSVIRLLIQMRKYAAKNPLRE